MTYIPETFLTNALSLIPKSHQTVLRPIQAETILAVWCDLCDEVVPASRQFTTHEIKKVVHRHYPRSPKTVAQITSSLVALWKAQKAIVREGNSFRFHTPS